MKTVLTIIKKEFSRFFKDRRMLATLFLPGILIYVIYSLIGGMVGTMMGVEEDQTYHVCVVNCPDWLTEETLSPIGNFVVETAVQPHDDIPALLKEKTFNAYLVFPESFDLQGGGANLQEVKLYQDSTDTVSLSAGQLLQALLSSMQYDAPKFLLTAEDVATEEDLSSMMLSMIGPMLVIVMLMTGCVAVAPESIAGEKERGTLATMLVTPVKRSRIAIGKVLALSAISVLSGLSSFIGIILALPKLTEGMGVGFSMGAFGVTEYAALLGVVLSTVLVLVAAVSILSTLAKSVKEATAMVSPVMIVVMVVSLASSFLSSGAWYFGCIPLLNSALTLGSVFSLSVNPLHVLLTVATNLVVAFGLGFLLTKMFESEKIIFSK